MGNFNHYNYKIFICYSGVIIMSIKCNGAFEGGGVKGIGLVGAISVFENNNYEFINIVGTSAGAIIGALLAVGYNTMEITKIMGSLNYLKFKQPSFLSKFGIIGKTLNIGLDFGIYNADYFEEWLNELLIKKGKVKFKDIKRNILKPEEHKYKLYVTASDLTNNRLLILPDDLKLFGLNPDEFSIAKAVRMSMSIPIFYEPFKLIDNYGNTHLIVDGGLLSNYPVWVLDNGKKETLIPTFGFKFVSDSTKLTKEIYDVNIIEYLKMIITTTLDAYDKEYISISKGDFARTVPISTMVYLKGQKKDISATNFAISKTESKELYKNGIYAAHKFLANWDFNEWKKKYRS